MASHYPQIPGQAGNDVLIYGFGRATSDYERMARASGEEVYNTPLVSVVEKEKFLPL